MHERTEDHVSRMAGASIKENINMGAGICARTAGTLWKKSANLDAHNANAGIVHQILRGYPGTRWHKIYSTILGI